MNASARPSPAKKPRALSGLDLTDLGDRNVGRLGRGAKAFGLRLRHGAHDLVIVAARKSGFEGGGIGGDHRLGGIRKRNTRHLNFGCHTGRATELGEIPDQSVGDIHRRRGMGSHGFCQRVARLRQQIA